MKTLPPRLRLLLALPAVASLVCGVLSGLSRLGFAMPAFISNLTGQHGALMTGGLFGTVIGLERAVAIGGLWPFAAPMLSGLAAACIIAGVPAPGPALLMCAAALVMTVACAGVWQRQSVAHHVVLTVAAAAWLVGNAVWLLTSMAPPAVPFWSAFLLLTIAGERLELSRFIPTPPAARTAFSVIVGSLLRAVTATLLREDTALRGFGVALIALAVWLARYDIARRTLRTPGLTRYIAVCLLSGYFWLAVAGMLGAAGAFENGASLRDAALHALLLGFVFSMVFGHAPIILPAVSTLRFHWHAGFYVPLVLLHAGLAVRVFAGLTERFALRQQSGVANALALLLFMLLVATSLRPARKTAATRGLNDSPLTTPEQRSPI
jgi:hypothetical protein